MQGIRHEDRHHTDEQIRDAVSFAVALMGYLEVPDDLRVAAFSGALNLRAAKQITVEPVVPGIPNMVVPKGRQ